MQIEYKKKYFPSGKIRNISSFVNGIKYGLDKTFYEDGGLSSTVSFINGTPHGIYKSWNTNGKLDLQLMFFNGMPYDEFGRRTHLLFIKKGEFVHGAASFFTWDSELSEIWK